MMPEIIFVMIGARRRVGKDTFANLLDSILEKQEGVATLRTSFALELKREVKFAIPKLDVFTEEPKLKEEIIRPLLIAWGQACRHIEPHYWVDKVVNMARVRQQDIAIDAHRGIRTLYVIISDWRFPNEYLRIQEKYTTVTVHIERPNIEAAGVEEIRNEPICKAHAQHHVYNGGSLNFLEEAAQKVARALLA